MATFSNTFTYFENTGELDFDVSVSSLDNETDANNVFELSFFYDAPITSIPDETFRVEESNFELSIANTISIPIGINSIFWKAKSIDESTTESIDGVIEIANFEYQEYPIAWNIAEKITTNLFDISLDVTKNTSNSNVFFCIASCSNTIELTNQHISEIFEIEFEDNIYLPFPVFTRRKEIYTSNTISSQIISYQSDLEDVSGENLSTLIDDTSQVEGKLLIYIGIQDGKQYDTVIATTSITPTTAPTTCTFDLQEDNLFIQNATYNSNTGIYDTDSAFLIGLKNVQESSYGRFCKIRIQGEDEDEVIIQEISEDNSYVLIASAFEETKYTFSGFDAFGNETANQIIVNCRHLEKPRNSYKIPDSTPKEAEILQEYKTETISFIKE